MNKDIEKLCWEPWENLTDEESIIVLLYTAIAFLQEDFESFFESGFNAEEVAEAFDEIGHRKAGCTVRLAHRLYCSDSSDPALITLGAAIYRMQGSLKFRLAEYLKRNIVDL